MSSQRARTAAERRKELTAVRRLRSNVVYVLDRLSALGLTDAQIAVRVGVTAANVAAWRSHGFPNYEHMAKLIELANANNDTERK